jgi:DNA processing protein
MTALPPERLIPWLRLARIPTIGPVLVKRALDALKTPERILAASPALLASIEGIGTQRAQAFAKAPSESAAAAELADATRHSITVLCPDSPNWPPGLRNIPDPPIVLFARGELRPQDAIAIGIVGSRNCTHYGQEQAGRFGALLAGAEITVISGGARGIDTAAHQGALRARGRTIVVQGCGLLNCYPPENLDLYDRIVREGSGVILSELPLEEPPMAENFPPRNRIIAGMSLGVLVIEANKRSGSLITARLAADDYGREVFALPGRVDSPSSSGTHHLIKTGSAHLVEDLQDILDNLGDVGTALTPAATPAVEAAPAPTASLFADPPAPAVAAPAPIATLTPAQAKIIAALDGDSANVDDICDRSTLPAAVVMAELTLLQIRGTVQRLPGNRFAKKDSR